MSAIRNTNCCEMGLLHTRKGPVQPTIHKDSYRDAFDEDGRSIAELDPHRIVLDGIAMRLYATA
jgi:hypothetical protein